MPNRPSGGPTGQTKGQIDEKFHDLLVSLRTHAAIAHNAVRGRHQTQWYVPPGLQTALLDVAKLHQPAFDRTKLNDAYEAATLDPKNAGTVGDVISYKLQIDYIASMERAFRARHSSLVRSFCHGAGRRYGQGHGKVWDDQYGVEAGVASFIAAGGASMTGASTNG